MQRHHGGWGGSHYPLLRRSCHVVVAGRLHCCRGESSSSTRASSTSRSSEHCPAIAAASAAASAAVTMVFVVNFVPRPLLGTHGSAARSDAPVSSPVSHGRPSFASWAMTTSPVTRRFEVGHVSVVVLFANVGGVGGRLVVGCVLLWGFCSSHG